MSGRLSTLLLNHRIPGYAGIAEVMGVGCYHLVFSQRVPLILATILGDEFGGILW